MGFNPRRGRRGASPRRGNAQNGRHNQNYDSNGPGVRIKGTAQQVYDKYCQLARDNLGADDPVLVESYLQHAEHYYRLAFPEPRQSERSGQDYSASEHQEAERPSMSSEDEGRDQAVEEDTPKAARRASDQGSPKNWQRPRFLEKPSRSDESPPIYTEGDSAQNDADESDAAQDSAAQDTDSPPLRRTSRRHALGTKTRSTRSAGGRGSASKANQSEKDAKQSDDQSSDNNDASTNVSHDDSQEPEQLSLSPPE